MIKGYLGVDVGSVSTNLVVIDDQNQLLVEQYLRTNGKPIQTVQEGLHAIGQDLPADVQIAGAATTGSARYLTSLIIGADIVKNYCSCHSLFRPGRRCKNHN